MSNTLYAAGSFDAARILARLLVAAVLAAVVALVVVPWQQSVPGTGRLIAYAPLERQQTIEAPIAGRLVHWAVQEGDHVEAGQLIAELSDNDPQILERLERERQAALVLYAVCLLFAITAWSLTWANSAQSALLLAWLAVMAFLFMRKLGYFPFVQAAMILERRRRNSRLRAEVQELGPAIRDATAADDMWGRIKGFVDQVEAAEMALELTERRAPGERVAIRYAVERDDAGVLDVDYQTGQNLSCRGPRG